MIISTYKRKVTQFIGEDEQVIFQCHTANWWQTWGLYPDSFNPDNLFLPLFQLDCLSCLAFKCEHVLTSLVNYKAFEKKTWIWFFSVGAFDEFLKLADDTEGSKKFGSPTRIDSKRHILDIFISSYETISKTNVNIQQMGEIVQLKVH